MPPVLTVDGLQVSIAGREGSARVLDHVAFDLLRGRILGVVGESGCGKSTLVRAILGVLAGGARVDAGRVVFEGQDLLSLTESRLSADIRGSRIGYVPQDPYMALNPVFTVGAQLLEIMRWHAKRDGLRGRARAGAHRARLVDLLRRVQMPDPESSLGRYPHQFSGGQRQRLVIAAALACSPSLIVADEPTTALDVTTQGQILVLLRELVDEFGLSMLFVTHDLGVVAELCDDVCVMYAGQSVEVGATADLLANPLHPYTRALLACHPDRSTSFVGIPGVVPSPARAPPGCRFSTRCGDARAACPTRRPDMVWPAPDRGVDCVLYGGTPVPA